jgi:hypothetical protein
MVWNFNSKQIQNIGLILLKMNFLKEFWLFIKERKKWWLLPLVIMLFLIALFIFLGASSALAPFVYSLF